jgi:hypothetical protein
LRKRPWMQGKKRAFQRFFPKPFPSNRRFAPTRT